MSAPQSTQGHEITNSSETPADELPKAHRSLHSRAPQKGFLDPTWPSESCSTELKVINVNKKTVSSSV